jgi:Tfp pilus assembly protein PilN
MKIRFNLLPKMQKKHLHIQKILRIVMEQEIHVMIVFLFLILGLFAIFFILKTEINIMQDIKSKVVEQEQYEDIIRAQEEFKDVHEKMKTVENLLGNHVEWSQLLILLSENISKNIKVNSIDINDDVVVIGAIADTREDVVRLKDMFRNIVKNEVNCFSDIVVPESQLTIPIDVTFVMTLKVNLECLK